MIILAFITSCPGVRAVDIVRTVDRVCDSLKNELGKPSLTKKKQMELYQMLIDWYASYAPDSILVYAPVCLKLAEELHDMEKVCTSYFHMDAAYNFRDNYDSAFFYYDKVRVIAVKERNKHMEADAIRMTAFSCARQGKYILAIDHYLKALAIYEHMAAVRDKEYERRGENRQQINILNNLSELNRRMNNTDAALRYLDMAAKLCSEVSEFILDGICLMCTTSMRSIIWSPAIRTWRSNMP
jgi:tetratricopeptide (TPR) repeat protein